MKRIRKLGLGAATAIVAAMALTASMGAGTASAKLWVEDGEPGEIHASSYPASVVSADANTSLVVNAMGIQTECADGAMKSTGTLVAPVPWFFSGQETLPLSSTFGKCTTTTSKSTFLTTVNMNGCKFNLSSGIWTRGFDEEYVIQWGLTGCAGSIVFTTKLGETTLCTTTVVVNSVSGPMPSETVNTETGFTLVAEPASFDFTAVGGFCPKKSGSGTLDLSLELNQG